MKIGYNKLYYKILNLTLNTNLCSFQTEISKKCKWRMSPDLSIEYSPNRIREMSSSVNAFRFGRGMNIKKMISQYWEFIDISSCIASAITSVSTTGSTCALSFLVPPWDGEHNAEKSLTPGDLTILAWKTGFSGRRMETRFFGKISSPEYRRLLREAGDLLSRLT